MAIVMTTIITIITTILTRKLIQIKFIAQKAHKLGIREVNKIQFGQVEGHKVDQVEDHKADQVEDRKVDQVKDRKVDQVGDHREGLAERCKVGQVYQIEDQVDQADSGKIIIITIPTMTQFTMLNAGFLEIFRWRL